MPRDQVVLVRHGATEWSETGRHTSFTDVALTEEGRCQARTLAARLAGRDFALVLASPRRRAIETADLAGLGDRAEITDDVAEWNYGEYEGLTIAQIRREVPGWTLFTHGPRGGEVADQVGARADRVIARCQAAGGVVAVFSHGHFLRVLGARWIGLPPEAGALLALDTGSSGTLGTEHDQRCVWQWNI